MGMWNELQGRHGFVAGTNGTATVPAGARVIQIVAQASVPGTASLVIFGNSAQTVPIYSEIELRFQHLLMQAGNNGSVTGSQDLVFTNTDSYFVEYVS